MSLKWQIIDSGTLPAEIIMEKDRELLSQLSPSSLPILHLYDWEGPSLTYGHFIQLDQHLDLAALEEEKIKTARRPTGGGILFHLTDLAFSILLPSSFPKLSSQTIENYRLINQAIACLLSDERKLEEVPSLYPKETSTHPFCMARKTVYDIMIEDKKVGGAAQRRTKEGLLHQGTLSLQPTSERLLNKILLDSSLPSIITSTSYSLALSNDSIAIEKTKKELQKKLKESLPSLLFSSK